MAQHAPSRPESGAQWQGTKALLHWPSAPRARWPLASAVGLLGGVNVLPALLQRTGWPFPYGSAITSVAKDMAVGALGSVPETAAGSMLLAMSIGLLWRSRFAWAMTLLMTATILLRRLSHHAGQSPLVLATGALLLALIVMRRTFDRSSLAAESSFAVLSLVSLLAFAVFGTYLLGQDFKPPVTDLLTALYFSVATLSTVGYGDIIPSTAEARLFVVSVIVIGVSIFAASLSTVVVPLLNRRLRRNAAEDEAMRRENHSVIVGNTTLARSTVRALRARGMHVTVVARSTAPAAAEDDDSLDVIVGDPADTRVLERAGVARCVALMALLEDDAENAFVVLAAREAGASAKTTVSVRNAENIPRVRLARPDFIISPELFSSEILAMVVNDETIDSASLLDRLLNRIDASPATG